MKQRMFLLIALVLGAFVLAGLSVGPAAAVTSSAVDRIPEYRLGPGDKVRVTVYGEESMGGEFLIGGAGKVALPLVGEVQAGGLTTGEFQKEVEAALRDGYLRDPK